MKKLISLTFIISLFFFASCSKGPFHEEKIFAGGKVVSAKKLNHGKLVYTENCMACHGVKGDGKGLSAKGMSLFPRDFTLGLYKFGKVPSGDLPHDETLKEIILKGLHGTGMLPWDLRGEQLDNVVQYLKTFSPEAWEGKDKVLGEKIVMSKNPYGEAHKSNAIARGKEVYHIVAQCQSCHRAYATKFELSEMSKKINNEPITEFEDNLYLPKLQESEYGYKSLPPDFTWDFVRSATTVEELYVRLAAGVGGTAMPAWQGVLEEDELWAVSHYVKFLMDMKDKPSRAGFVSKFR